MPIDALHPDAALVLVDLQPMITSLPTVHPADAVVENAVRLAQAFRDAGKPVVLVRVAFSPDGGDAITAPTDQPVPRLALDEDGMKIDPRLGPDEGDLVITKRGWDAFFGTELDLQLRRRGVRSIVIGGIRTAIGVESTARTGYLHGYEQVFATDAMTDIDLDAHDHTVEKILPRLGRRAETADVLDALQ